MTATWLLALAIVAAGAALQAATGMGMALLAAPLLVLIDPSFVPGPTLCTVIALSAAVAWRDRGGIDRGILATSLLGLAVGCLVGAAALAILIGFDLARIFAVLILFVVLLSLTGLQLRTSRPILLAGGAASGVLGTMFGVHGPPIALVLQHEAPDRLRATLCAFFTVGGSVSLAALATAGLFPATQLVRGFELLPGVVVGLAIAPLLARRLDRRRTRHCVLAISALSAVALLFR